MPRDDIINSSKSGQYRSYKTNSPCNKEKIENEDQEKHDSDDTTSG